ncbi:MAG: VWA domain-containing protein, partial [Thermoguttaceae bacterium]
MTNLYDPYQHFQLSRPAWLAALAVVPLVIVAMRGSLARQSARRRFATLVFRSLALGSLILALCDPVAHRPGPDPWAILLVDRSESISPQGAAAAKAFVHEAVAKLGDDRVAVVPFAATAGQPGGAESLESTQVDPLGTDLAGALARAASAATRPGLGRIVLLSDGNATVPGNVTQRALALQRPVDTVPLASRTGDDVWIESVTWPSQVRPGDTALVQVQVASDRACQATLRVTSPNVEVARKEIAVPAGQVTTSLQLELGPGPRDIYRIVLEASHDRQPANNQWELAVWHGPPGRTLLVGRETDAFSQLAGAIGRAKLQAQTILPDRFPQDLDGLSQFDLLVLADVPAAAFSARQQDQIESYVRDWAGGLLVFGGENSLTAGDYRGTPLERALPITCQFDAKASRPSLAIVLAIDQSGSMEEGDAIGLAKTAIRKTVEMLDAQDELGVIAFQDTTRWIVPLEPCENRQEVFRAIESLAAGGGTNMEPAIAKAHLALRGSYAELKHLIVLTDGISYPGDFDSLAAETAASGITISTVGVGPDAAEPLLRAIAQLGGGTYHHCTSAAQVPEIFVRETAKAARIGIREEPATVQVASERTPMASLAGQVPPTLLGYVQTRARPEAQVAMTLQGRDPLAAWCQYGRGRAAVFTSQLHGPWIRPWHDWPGAETVWTTLVRQTVRPGNIDGYQATCQRVEATTLVTLDAVPSGRFQNDAQVVVEATGPGGAKQRLAMSRVAPGQYSAEVATPEPGIYDFLVTSSLAGRHLFSGRCSACPSYPSELVPRPTN